jgi:hypothetical protein
MSVFTPIYELIPGIHDERELLDREVFPMVGMATLGITLLFVLFYYYVLNGISNNARYNRTSYWVALMVINSIIAFFVALSRIANKLEVYFEDYETYFYVFAVENAFYSIIMFLLFSLIFKNWSRHAPFTPVKFPIR